MQINLWYNNANNQWRWVLVDEQMNMESGNQKKLEDAFRDIYNTVKFVKKLDE